MTGNFYRIRICLVFLQILQRWQSRAKSLIFPTAQEFFLYVTNIQRPGAHQYLITFVSIHPVKSCLSLVFTSDISIKAQDKASRLQMMKLFPFLQTTKRLCLISIFTENLRSYLKEQFTTTIKATLQLLENP